MSAPIFHVSSSRYLDFLKIPVLSPLRDVDPTSRSEVIEREKQRIDSTETYETRWPFFVVSKN